MDIIEAIRKRRSVRKFEDRAVPDEALTDILEAVRWAPSWANTQCWEVVVISDGSTREQLKETVVPGNPASGAIVKAPLLLALCGKLERAGYYRGKVTTKFGDWFMFDLGIATQNICLAAHAHGLGTVIVGLLDHDRAKEILKAPENCEMVVLIPVGYPSGGPIAPGRREIEDFTHSDVFG